MEDKLSNSRVQHLAVSKLKKVKKKKEEKKHICHWKICFCTILDLLKATYTINHDLLLAKLMVFGFSPNALKWMYSFKQKKTKNSNQQYD